MDIGLEGRKPALRVTLDEITAFEELEFTPFDPHRDTDLHHFDS